MMNSLPPFMNSKRLISLLMMISLLTGMLAFPGITTFASAEQQSLKPEDQAANLLKQLTPQERVGQLFLVTFKGIDTSGSTQIHDLIANSHVGGVVLREANDNFVKGTDMTAQVAGLTSSLQSIGWNTIQNGETKTPDSSKNSAYIPLFIGVSQEGDGAPYDQMVDGISPLPNEMSIGATWDTSIANKVGKIAGMQLGSMGYNLLLGPSLDVLEVPIAEGSEDLGTRTFGGDPFWVGEMGKAYISGIHEGSENRIMVVASHFPGRGGSDRLPEEEVATVQKSLEQLKQIELAPFFAVTGNAPDTGSQTDGLLVSHIRYQGFQGNIRATTRPVSFDPSALSLLMSLPEFSKWRDTGGIIVSDDLGSTAVRKFNDPTERNFDSKAVARNAFLAGNDLLYMDDFQGTGDADSYTGVVRTIQSFAQKYNEDPSFAQRVDASVLRILTMKFRLYSNFSLDKVIPPIVDSNLAIQAQQISMEVAQKSITLINPEAAELSSLLPKPPVKDERMVFITDTLTTRQCRTCPDVTTPAVDALQNAVLRFYGPLAGGQVQQSKLSSFSFTDLETWLTTTTNEQNPAIQTALQQADWIVFGMLNLDKNRTSSAALRDLLKQKPEYLRNKKSVVFALNAPYYLDATDISKLTAYYGCYGKIPAFIDIAARVLFQEVTPKGASPISIPGVGYDLSAATSPDPNQIISLSVDLPEKTEPAGTATPEPTAIPKFNVGDTLPIKTGVIVDQNHKPVPDGTVARFIISTGGEKGVTSQTEATTIGGVVRLAYRIENPGLLEIKVTSDPAIVSDILRLDITGKESAAVTSIAPTPIPTDTSEPAIPSPTVQPTMQPIPSNGKISPTFWDWLLTMMITGIAVSVIFIFGTRQRSVKWGFRWGLTTGIGGLITYLYLSMGLPGSDVLIDKGGTPAILGVTILGMGLGWLVGYVWMFTQKKENPFKT